MFEDPPCVAQSTRDGLFVKYPKMGL